MIINQYKKDEKNLMILERIANDEKAKFSFYNNGNRVDKFIETKDTKIVELNSSDSVLGMPAVDILQTENFGQKILSAAIAKISSVEVNGINCYAVDRFIFRRRGGGGEVCEWTGCLWNGYSHSNYLVFGR